MPNKKVPKKTTKSKVVTNVRPKNKINIFASKHGALLLAALFALIGIGTVVWARAATTTNTLWSTSIVPKTITETDSQPVELGTKFKSKYAGQVTGIRYYKGPQNSGTHVGHLWTRDGRLVASVTFANETAAGWQTADFDKPVDIVANTTYIVSYFAPRGYYSVNASYFKTAYTNKNATLSAPKNAGVYKYGSKSVFPSSTYAASNYWVDPVVKTSLLSPTEKPKAPTNLNASAQDDGINLTWSLSASNGIAQQVIMRNDTAFATLGSTTTTYKDTTVEAGKTYSYQVKAIDVNGLSSDLSDKVTADAKTSSSTGSGSNPGSGTDTGSGTGSTPTTPSSGTKCAAKPSDCGYPDETNTGVPAGTKLQAVGPGKLTSGSGWHYDSRGWVAIDTEGAVLENLDVPYNIDITASNVTIRNVRIVQPGDSFGVSIRHAKNVKIEHSTIMGTNASSGRLLAGIKDIYGDSANTIAQSNNISLVSTGIQFENGIIQDNYIHDMGYIEGDHVNGTTSNGSTSSLTISHNTVFNQISQTDAISLFQDFGTQTNKTIDNNLVAGGGYCIYGGSGNSATSNIKITNNRFSKKFFANCGDFGPLAAFDASGTGNVFSGNIWDETGDQVR